MLRKRLLLGPLGIVQPHGHGQIPIKTKLGLEEGIGLARGQPSENFVILLADFFMAGLFNARSEALASFSTMASGVSLFTTRTRQLVWEKS